MTNSSLFVLHHNSDLVYVLVYVDDLLFTGSNPTLINSLITQLSDSFAIKDLGELHYFLRIEAVQTSHGMVLSQHKSALDLFVKVGMTTYRPCSTPFSLRSEP